MLICEGPSDVAFFQNLIRQRNLPKCRVKDTADKKGEAAGNTRFGERLRSLQFESGVKNILIVADNDDNPQRNFDDVCRQIKQVYGTSHVPARPLQRSGERPSITILMIPWENECGCLESLCIEAARSINRQIASEVDQFAACIHTDRWNNEIRVYKMWLRTMLAASCERDPFIVLRNIFNNHRNRHLIPADHRCFDRVANALRTFDAI